MNAHNDSIAGDDINLQAYLQRIGYAGPLDPGFDLLATLVERHLANIPFEAIDVMLGRGVDLDPAAIDHKLLEGHRGGYCFEHASLMRRALRAIGFSVRQNLGRVWNHGSLDGPTPAATHACLKVEADGRAWLVDVGFGGNTPDQPLAWQPDIPQATRYNTYRLVETRDGLRLESRLQDRWSPLYEILDFHWQPVDFKLANHYTATFPTSHFRHRLGVALTEPQVRTTLSGNRLRQRMVDGTHSESTLDVPGLADALATRFGLPVADDWTPLLERVVAETDEENT